MLGIVISYYLILIYHDKFKIWIKLFTTFYKFQSKIKSKQRYEPLCIP